MLQETQSAGRFLGPISHSIQALPPTVSRVQEHVPLGLIPAPRSVFSTSASTLLVAGNNRIHRRACAPVASIPTANCRAKVPGRAVWVPLSAAAVLALGRSTSSFDDYIPQCIPRAESPSLCSYYLSLIQQEG